MEKARIPHRSTPPPRFEHRSPPEVPPDLSEMDRSLEKALADCWDEIQTNLGGHRGGIRYSGILPLGDPWLLPFIAKPGLFFILGPPPPLRLLCIGHSQAPLVSAVNAAVQERGGRAPTPPALNPLDNEPAFLACVSMEEEVTLVRPLRALVTRRMRRKDWRWQDDG